MAKIKSVFIRSLRNGFRRCGVAHPAGWVEHPEGTFTEEQIETLKNEPMLIVSDMADTGTGSESLKKKEKELAEREADLDTREKELAEREAALKK